MAPSGAFCDQAPEARHVYRSFALLKFQAPKERHVIRVNEGLAPRPVIDSSDFSRKSFPWSR
jgi:hypothetical protein